MSMRLLLALLSVAWSKGMIREWGMLKNWNGRSRRQSSARSDDMPHSVVFAGCAAEQCLHG